MFHRRLFLTSLVLTLSINLLAQDWVNTYSDDIEAAKECLRSGEKDCRALFYRSVGDVNALDQDSLVASVHLEVYNEVKAAGGDFDLVWGILRQGIDVSNINPVHHSKAVLYAEMGNTILDYGRQEDHMAYYDSAVTHAMQTYSDAIKSQVLVARARGLEVNGQLGLCIQELQKARAYADNSEHLVSRAQISMGLANAYNMNGDFELAKDQLLVGADLLLEAGDTLRYYYARTNWCNVSMSLDQPELVLDVLPDCIAYFRESGRAGLVPFPLSQLGRAYEMLDQQEKAIPILKESAQLCSELGLNTQLAYNHLILANAYNAIGEHNSGLKFAEAAYTHYSERGESTENLDAAEVYVNSLERANRHKEANVVWRNYVQAKDSLFSADKVKEIAKIQSLLELEKKESELCAQQNEIGLLEEEKRRIATRNIALGIVLLLVGVIAWLFVKRKSALIKLQEVENKQLERDNQHQKRELTSQALHLAQKNEFLLDLKKELEENSSGLEAGNAGQLINRIKFDEQMDQNWDQFMTAFKESSPELLKKLNEVHPDLTKKEVQLCALTRMGLSTKEAASLLHVSVDAVKKARYRLRKKLQLDTNDSLEKYLQGLVG